jgi:hypothetical protein
MTLNYFVALYNPLEEFFRTLYAIFHMLLKQHILPIIKHGYAIHRAYLFSNPTVIKLPCQENPRGSATVVKRAKMFQVPFV